MHPEEGANTRMAFYHTPASSTVSKAVVPVGAKPPNHPVPVRLLARLAFDEAYQGKRYEDQTLVNALSHSVQLTANGLTANCVILDVLDEETCAFYDMFEIFIHSQMTQ